MDDTQELLEATAEALGYSLAHARFVHENVYGEGVIRCFELTLQDAEGAELSQVVYLENSPTHDEIDGILVFRDEASGDSVAVWIYPTDPALPALPVAVFPDAAQTVLTRMGIDGMGVDGAGIELSLVAYRPGKRAVVRARGEQHTVWLKVVRPKTIKALHALYELWEAAGLPVPQTLGWSDEGLIGFTNLPGVTATSVVTTLGDDFLASVEQLTQEYATLSSTGPARASLVSSRHWYARKAAGRTPHLTTDIETVVARIDELFVGVTQPADVTVHADLHLGQLFVDPAEPSRIIGVLDIDTAGFGDPADDAAAMYAHLIVSQFFQRDPASPESLAYERLARTWRDRVRLRNTEADPRFFTRFTAIAATHLIAHSLGGFAPAEQLIGQALALTDPS